MSSKLSSYEPSYANPSEIATYDPTFLRNGKYHSTEAFRNRRKVAHLDSPISDQSQKTSLENVDSRSEDRACFAANRFYSPCKEDKNKTDEEKELKPSDFTFFASNSTLHGISHIFTSSPFTFRKALWLCAFLASAGVFLNQGWNRYRYYRSHPHITKLDEKEAENLTFPAVTICNMNPFRLDAVTTDDFFYTGRELLKIFERNFELRKDIHKDNRTWQMIQQKIAPITSKTNYFPKSDFFDMFEFYDRTGHLIQGIVKYCKFDGRPCKDKHWSPVYTRYGKCYTFNSGKKFKPLKTLKGGIDNGLEILLDTEQDDYMPVWEETDEISVEAGFKVQIHVQDEPPFIHELGFGISPGFQTLVATQEQRITFLPQPYGVCESGKNKTKHSHFKKYSISACRITCETNFVVDKCGCKLIHMPGNASFCPPETYKRCADKKLDMLVESDDKICVCGTPCDVTRYNLEMSTLQLPSTQALSYMAYKYKKTEEYVKNNFVKLNIFFEALNYETIEQKKAYEIPGLFGDIGGQMGLFIGASLLTLLELFDYLYEVLKYKFGKRKRLNKESSRNMTSEMDSKEREVIHSSNHLQHNHGGNLSPYTPSGYLSPPQNFSSGISKPFMPPRAYNKESCYGSPMTQHFGNSVMTLRGNRFQDKETEAMGDQHVGLPPQMLLQKGRKGSLSYNDLYRASDGNPTNDHQPQTATTPNYLNYNTMGPSKIGYVTSTTNPVSSGSYFRNRGNYATVNGRQKPFTQMSNSQVFPMATEDFPVAIETDIH